MLDPFCSDPFDNSTANPKDCSLATELPHLRGVPAIMCRKIRMKGESLNYALLGHRQSFQTFILFISLQ